MLMRIKEAVKSFLVTCFDKLNWFVGRFTYIIPLILSIPVLVMAAYLFCNTLSSLDDMKTTIKSLPVVIQTEMSKTRDTFREEATSTRELHQATKEEMEAQRDQLQKKLATIEQKVDSKKPQTIVVGPEQKRKKILGIF
jgi:hypothetical protein